MRRILLVVVGLVALLAAAIVVPAVAQTSPAGNNAFGRLLASALALPLGATLGQDEAEKVLRDWLGSSPDANGVIISPLESNSSEEEDHGVSSSSSSNPDSSNSSDLIIVDPNGSNADPAASQEFSERRIQSGSASPSSSFSNTGDNVNACPTTQQVVNTGNVANEQGVTQYNSTADDVDLTSSSITITSDQTATCDQTLDQAAAAGK